MMAPDVSLLGLQILKNASPRLSRELVARMMFVLGLLLHRALLFGGENYHSIHARTLGRLIGPRHVRAILTALVRGGIIRTDRLYIVGKKARGYRLAPWVLQRGIIDVVLNRELALAVKRCGSTGAPALHLPAHRILYENLRHLSVDPAAWHALNDQAGQKPGARANWIHTLCTIERRAFTFTVSENTGRVFNVLTGAASMLRPFLRLDGRAPAEVDVRACQPFLLAALYPPDSVERARYVAAVTQGDFYALFHAARAETAPDRPPRSRAGIKLAVQVEVLFGGPKHRRAVWDLFAREFPELASLLDRFHRTSPVTLATHLQRLESDIIVARVVPQLHTVLRGRPFLTIHDAVFCIAEDADTVARVIGREFGAVVGAAPGVKISIGSQEQSTRPHANIVAPIANQNAPAAESAALLSFR